YFRMAIAIIIINRMTSIVTRDQRHLLSFSLNAKIMAIIGIMIDSEMFVQARSAAGRATCKPAEIKVKASINKALCLNLLMQKYFRITSWDNLSLIRIILYKDYMKMFKHMPRKH